MIKYISFPGLGINEFAVNSVAFTVFGKDIAWYGIIITFGIICGYIYSNFRAVKTEGLKRGCLDDYCLAGVIFGVIGARIWYVATTFERYKADSFLETLKNCVAIWEGGLGFYGGLILGLISVIVIALIKKENVFQRFDILCPAVMIAQIFGRWGNFMNGEAYGYETDIFCRMGIRLESEAAATYYHPTFFYESFWNLIGFLIINFTYKKKKYHGQIFLRYITWYGFGRFFVEGMRTDSLYIFGDIRISQAFGALCFLVGSALLIAFDILYYFRKKDEELVSISNGLKPAEETAATEESTEESSENTEACEESKTKTDGESAVSLNDIYKDNGDDD